MSTAQPVERPRTVTILGWTFLVVSVLLFLRSAINFLIFAVLESQASELLSRLNAAARPFVPEWMLQHVGAIWAGQAVLAGLVALTAWSFLSLKPWARLCLQGVCWVALALIACGATVWILLDGARRRRPAADGASPRTDPFRRPLDPRNMGRPARRGALFPAQRRGPPGLRAPSDSGSG